MNIEDMILENNAMLKVMLKNQVQMITVLDEVLEALDKKTSSEAVKDMREQIVKTRMLLAQVEVDRAKTIMLRDELVRNQQTYASADELGDI